MPALELPLAATRTLL